MPLCHCIFLVLCIRILSNLIIPSIAIRQKFLLFQTLKNISLLNRQLISCSNRESTISTPQMLNYDSLLPTKSVFNADSTFEDLDNYSSSVDAISLTIHHNHLHGLHKINELKKFFLIYPRAKKVDKSNPPLIKLFLCPSITKNISNWPLEAQSYLSDKDHEISKDKVFFTYKDLSLAESLYLLSPEDNFKSIAYETIGHIAHLNLTENRLPIRHLIGKVIYDKNKYIKTVVNKIGKLDNVFRTMELELIYGEKNYITTLIENGLKFRIDYENVYWNSRLEHERGTISQMIKPDDIVVDVFAGVGAFAMYTANKGCVTFANDLNPVATKYICENAKLNKLDSLIHSYNMDAREFIAFIFSKNSILPYMVNTKLNRGEVVNLHVLMNLPEMAVEYLDSFQCLNDFPRINVYFHTYFFSKDSPEKVEERVEQVLGYKPNATVREVRTVSPNKIMYCIEFPWEYPRPNSKS